MHAQLALTGGVYDEDVLTDTADRIDVSFEAWVSLSRTPLFRTGLATLDEQEH